MFGKSNYLLTGSSGLYGRPATRWHPPQPHHFYADHDQQEEEEEEESELADPGVGLSDRLPPSRMQQQQQQQQRFYPPQQQLQQRQRQLPPPPLQQQHHQQQQQQQKQKFQQHQFFHQQPPQQNFHHQQLQQQPQVRHFPQHQPQLQQQQQRLQQQQQPRLQQQQPQQQRQQHSCSLCDLDFGSAAELQAHREESSEHKSLRKMQICREECLKVYGYVNEHKLMQFVLHFCHSCCVAFENEVQLQRHLSSSAHAGEYRERSPPPRRRAHSSRRSSPTEAGGARSRSRDRRSAGRDRDRDRGRGRDTGRDGRAYSDRRTAGVGGHSTSRDRLSAGRDRRPADGHQHQQQQHQQHQVQQLQPANVGLAKPIFGVRNSAELMQQQQQHKQQSEAKPQAVDGKATALLGRPDPTKLRSAQPPALRGAGRRRGVRPPAFRSHCHLCNVHLNSEQSSKEHFGGRKHLAAVEASRGQREPTAGGDGVGDGDGDGEHAVCDTCGVRVRQDQMEAHRKSSAHTAALAKVGANMMKLMGSG